ncbi:MAG TPA: transglutaminase family protein [Abditibacteriaceae bacterium]|jgi:transglutaminase-like putative cysteine protease
MLFHITKKLRISYSAPVQNCVRRLRVLPPDALQESWNAYPEPDECREFSDEFGNRVLELRHAKIESALLFELACRAEPPTPLVRGLNSNASELILSNPCSTNSEHSPLTKGVGGSTSGLPPTGMGAFLLPSALCDLGEAIRQNASSFGAESTQTVTQICQWTHQALLYDASVSSVETTASQSLLRGGGVCQDYAHLMIALCRANALPARYVSGYLIGEGRMHAWVEVLIKNQWRAFDPTHNREVGNECLPVAIGRDFRDCNPHQGTFRGHAKAKLESGCYVRHTTTSS